MERGRIQRLFNVLSTPIIPGTSEATNIKFCTHIHTIDRNNKPIKHFGKSSRGRTQGLSKIFRTPIYI